MLPEKKNHNNLRSQWLLLISFQGDGLTRDTFFRQQIQKHAVHTYVQSFGQHARVVRGGRRFGTTVNKTVRTGKMNSLSVEKKIN